MTVMDGTGPETKAGRQPTLTVPAVEIPTLGLVLADYAALWLALTLLPPLSLWLAVPVVAVLLALHSSLQHEVLHGHPFRSLALNEALVWLPVGLCIPYRRFRDTHLAHHRDERLTDPHDDPESNYVDPDVWARWGRVRRQIHLFNNTLAGRMLIGPMLSEIAFVAEDLAAVRAGQSAVALAWLHHLAGLAVVLWLLTLTPMPLWAYAAAAYGAFSILKIRTFAEHRAHEEAPMRSVLVEDRGPLAFLFLNNNLHIVHHSHPGVPWYRLPRLYARNRAEYLHRNGGYLYRSYGQLFRAHFLRRKDPVPHPLWRGRGGWRRAAGRDRKAMPADPRNAAPGNGDLSRRVEAL